MDKGKLDRQVQKERSREFTKTNIKEAIEMAKCPNCGETLITFYARSGARLLLCPSVKLSNMTHKNPISAVLYCNGDIIKDNKTIRDDVLLELTQISRRITRIQKKLIA